MINVLILEHSERRQFVHTAFMLSILINALFLVVVSFGEQPEVNTAGR